MRQLETLKNRIQTDAHCREWFVSVKKEADTTLDEAPAEYDIYDGDGEYIGSNYGETELYVPLKDIYSKYPHQIYR